MAVKTGNWGGIRLRDLQGLSVNPTAPVMFNMARFKRASESTRNDVMTALSGVVLLEDETLRADYGGVEGVRLITILTNALYYSVCKRFRYTVEYIGKKAEPRLSRKRAYFLEYRRGGGGEFYYLQLPRLIYRMLQGAERVDKLNDAMKKQLIDEIKKQEAYGDG